MTDLTSGDRDLLDAAGFFFDADDEMPPHTLNMNDVWSWASGDCETVPDTEMPELTRLFRDYGWCGVLYWVSEKRGGIRSEFLDNNRFIDFVRNEERLKKEIPGSSQRAYHKMVYTLGEDS